MRTLEPAATYELLVKQFQALATFCHCLEQRLAVQDGEKWAERLARNQLDSERAANAALTAELELANARIKLLELELDGKRRKQVA